LVYVLNSKTSDHILKQSSPVKRAPSPSPCFIPTLMKKEEVLLNRRKKNDGRHLSAQGTEKHATLKIEVFEIMLLCASEILAIWF